MIKIITICLATLLPNIALSQSYKHPYGKKIGFTENIIATSDGDIDYEVECVNSKYMGISYKQILRLPKLPHTLTLGPDAGEQKSALHRLKLVPPANIKIVRIIIKNKDNQIINVNGAYGAPYETSVVKIDDTSLAASKLNEPIKVEYAVKAETEDEDPIKSSAKIPIYRVDRLPEHLVFITKKIKEEGHHENDWGDSYSPLPAGAHEKLYYFPQPTSPITSTCIGYANHVVRHGLQKWRGAGSAVSGPPNIPAGIGSTSGVAYAESLLKQDGWKIYFFNNGIEDAEGVFAPFANVSITEEIIDIANNATAQARYATLIKAEYAYLIKQSGGHVANWADGTVYESHIFKANDAIFGTASSINAFLKSNHGFLVIPPSN